MSDYIARQTAMPHLVPERVRAVQWSGDNWAEVRRELPEVSLRAGERTGSPIVSTDCSGDIHVEVDQWIIRTDSGYRLVMFPDHFAYRYGLVREIAQ